MELQFRKSVFPCLTPVLSEVQNLEQTQEVRIPEGMPGAERILGAWGQVLLRSKEWRPGSVNLSAGILVWVLYMPEEGGSPQRVESWIPFQMNWDLPEDSPEGQIRIRCLPRFVDARSVSAGKILIRAGIAALAEAWVPVSGEVYQPEEIPEDLELLRGSYPVRLPVEAGEKTFLLDEELTLPASAPQPERLVYYRMDPAVGDRKVLANKVVFRGNGNLHVLYESEEGQLHGWDFELPFSQFADLQGSFSSDAQADILPGVTNLELDDEGKLRLKAGLTGQYLVDDRQMLELVEDAYSPGRELTLRRGDLELPVVLDSRRENIYGEQTIPGSANLMVDTAFLPDFPRQQRTEEGVLLEQPGMVQMLYYDADGALQSASHRWEGRQTLRADEGTKISVVPMSAPEPQILPGSDSITLRGEVPVQVTASAGQGMPMVTGLELGEVREADPGRPSLILRRAENMGLWDLAKASGSTMAAIRSANDLQGEPAPGQMLLIPVV